MADERNAAIFVSVAGVFWALGVAALWVTVGLLWSVVIVVAAPAVAIGLHHALRHRDPWELGP